MAQRTRYTPGSFCWVGLAASDRADAAAFYTRLFGWQADELAADQAGTYSLFRRGGDDVAIAYRQTAEARAARARPHWTSYISVEDADATAARARELGGAAVFREPFDADDAGRVAAIRDPTGAIVSLWQPRSRIGATLVNDPGAWCWNELATTDVERAKSFFAELLGWEYGTDDSGQVWIRNDGRLNGSIRKTRATPPQWLPHFAVADVEEAARRAEQLGARRLGPAERTRRGRSLMLADPQAAMFAIFEGETDP